MEFKNLLVATINGLKKMGKRNERTVPGITMWTMIAVRLTHLIFQYSGEPEACTLNTTDQNAHILKNFDLNEFRVVFNDTSTTLYRKMITIVQDKLKPMVVSSMLDHDSLHGNTSGKSIEVRTSDLFRMENVLEFTRPLSNPGSNFSFISPYIPPSCHSRHLCTLGFNLYTFSNACVHKCTLM